VGKPAGKRPRRRWVDLREIGWEVMNQIDLAESRDEWRVLVNTIMNLGLHKILGIS
jgi:hypothetical protein